MQTAIENGIIILFVGECPECCCKISELIRSHYSAMDTWILVVSCPLCGDTFERAILK